MCEVAKAVQDLEPNVLRSLVFMLAQRAQAVDHEGGSPAYDLGHWVQREASDCRELEAEYEDAAKHYLARADEKSARIQEWYNKVVENLACSSVIPGL
tara:strand:+ start:152 stop:445 length:294 start_codon:yes stop_codon:yes gene_type:complete